MSSGAAMGFVAHLRYAFFLVLHFVHSGNREWFADRGQLAPGALNLLQCWPRWNKLATGGHSADGVILDILFEADPVHAPCEVSLFDDDATATLGVQWTWGNAVTHVAWGWQPGQPVLTPQDLRNKLHNRTSHHRGLAGQLRQNESEVMRQQQKWRNRGLQEFPERWRAATATWGKGGDVCCMGTYWAIKNNSLTYACGDRCRTGLPPCRAPAGRGARLVLAMPVHGGRAERLWPDGPPPGPSDGDAGGKGGKGRGGPSDGDAGGKGGKGRGKAKAGWAGGKGGKGGKGGEGGGKGGKGGGRGGAGGTSRDAAGAGRNVTAAEAEAEADSLLAGEPNGNGKRTLSARERRMSQKAPSDDEDDEDVVAAMNDEGDQWM